MARDTPPTTVAPATTRDSTAVVALHDVAVRGEHAPILTGIDWVLRRGEHAVLLGPNGAGKTTLLQLVAGLRHASSGTVDVLGQRIGRVDVRRLRRRIGIVSDGLGDLVDRRSQLRRLVAASLDGRTTAAGARPSTTDLERAAAALARVGVEHLGDRRGTEVSEGEWKRTLLARALVTDPALLLLDEPFNGLDLAERERLLGDLDRAMGQDGPTIVLVTHHLEHVPTATTHALLLRDGAITADGPVEDAITDRHVSRTFGVAVEVARRRGRISAVAVTPDP